MSIVGFSRPLLNIFVVAAIAIASLSVAHAAPDACAVLTAAEVSSAVGQTVGPPSGGSQNGEGGGQCEYGFEVSNQPGFNTFGVELYQFKSAAEAQKWFSSHLNNSDDAIGTQKPTLEPGVGDAAYSKLGVLAATKAAEWVAIRGTRGIQISVVTASLPPHDRLRALMLTALSR
jgi:hypothetical protein